MFKINSGAMKFIVFIGIILLLMIPFSSVMAAGAQEVAGSQAGWPDWSAIWALIYPRLTVLLLLAVLDALFGIILALIGKIFNWDYFLHFLQSDILPIFAWMATAFISTIPAEFFPQQTVPIVEWTIYVGVLLAILKSLYGHFEKIGVLRAGGILLGPQ